MRSPLVPSTAYKDKMFAVLITPVLLLDPLAYVLSGIVAVSLIGGFGIELEFNKVIGANNWSIGVSTTVSNFTKYSVLYLV